MMNDVVGGNAMLDGGHVAETYPTASSLIGTRLLLPVRPHAALLVANGGGVWGAMDPEQSEHGSIRQSISNENSTRRSGT